MLPSVGRMGGGKDTCRLSAFMKPVRGDAIVSINNEDQAGWAVHREKFFGRSFWSLRNVSAYRLSVELRVSPPTINDIVREKRGITPEMAARLAKYFGTSEQFWLNLQDVFAVHRVKEKYAEELQA